MTYMKEVNKQITVDTTLEDGIYPCVVGKGSIKVTVKGKVRTIKALDVKADDAKGIFTVKDNKGTAKW